MSLYLIRANDYTELCNFKEAIDDYDFLISNDPSPDAYK